MDFTDVPMLKIWPILADTDTDINIGASLILFKAFKILDYLCGMKLLYLFFT